MTAHRLTARVLTPLLLLSCRVSFVRRFVARAIGKFLDCDTGRADAVTREQMLQRSKS